MSFTLMGQNRNEKSSGGHKTCGSFLSRHRPDAQVALQQSPILQSDMDRITEAGYNGKREVKSLRPFTQFHEQTRPLRNSCPCYPEKLSTAWLFAVRVIRHNVSPKKRLVYDFNVYPFEQDWQFLRIDLARESIDFDFIGRFSIIKNLICASTGLFAIDRYQRERYFATLANVQSMQFKPNRPVPRFHFRSPCQFKQRWMIVPIKRGCPSQISILCACNKLFSHSSVPFNLSFHLCRPLLAHFHVATYPRAPDASLPRFDTLALSRDVVTPSHVKLRSGASGRLPTARLLQTVSPRTQMLLTLFAFHSRSARTEQGRH